MASLWKHPKSKYWTACYTNRDGKQMKRSTKQTERKKALLIAVEWERIDQLSRHGALSTQQIQKVFNEVVEKTTGGTILTPPVDKFLDEWLTHMQPKISEHSLERYKKTKKLFLEYLKEKASMPITGITPGHIEGFLSDRLKGGVAAQTAIVDIKTLSSAFKHAERYAMIMKNPVQAITLPKSVSSEREVFSHEQIKMLLDTVTFKSEWFTLILLGYFSGARLGDCATMKWDNVNMKERVISYKQKKTGKVVRVPMVEDLFEHLQFISEFIDSEYLCPELAARGSGGKHGLSESFNRIVKRAGIDPKQIDGKGKRKFNCLTFHSLRHSFNSTLANAGVNQEIRMKLTGHSSFGINDRYTHHSLKPLEDAISTMPSFSEQEGKPGK